MFTVRNFLDTKCYLQSVEIARKDNLYLDPGADGQLFQHFSVREQEGRRVPGVRDLPDLGIVYHNNGNSF